MAIPPSPVAPHEYRIENCNDWRYRGVVKIVADSDDERILGIYIRSPLATEIIQQGYYAVKNRMNLQDLIDSYYVFPAVSEIISLCARKFRRDDKSDCLTMITE